MIDYRTRTLARQDTKHQPQRVNDLIIKSIQSYIIILLQLTNKCNEISEISKCQNLPAALI